VSEDSTPSAPPVPPAAAASEPVAAPAPLSASARLVWERASGERVEFPLDRDVLEVGRDEGLAIRVDEPLVSRRHATIERRGDAWVVVDQDSTNFTRVNGDRVRRERELSHGDEVRFGRTALRFLAE
jgi:pSer/pThr/pTyr-binding forkhead associated (FHA) protein